MRISTHAIQTVTEAASWARSDANPAADAQEEEEEKPDPLMCLVRCGIGEQDCIGSSALCHRLLRKRTWPRPVEKRLRFVSAAQLCIVQALCCPPSPGAPITRGMHEN